MKGKRSESNLYELQIDSDFLGHKSDDGVVCESKKLTLKIVRVLDLRRLLVHVPKLLIMMLNLTT